MHGRRRGSPPPQHRMNSGDELPRLKRLGEVVIRSEFQPDDLVGEIPAAVSMMIGTGDSARMALQTAKPSIPGSMRSRTRDRAPYGAKA